MYVYVIDTINSILQSIMFIVAANYCVNKNSKKNKFHLFLLIISLWGLITITTYILGNSSLSIIIIHIIEFIFIVILAYRKDSLGAAIGFTLIYLIIGIIVMLSLSIFVLLIKKTNINTTLLNILVMYIPQFLISYLVLRNMNIIYRLNLIIKSRISSIVTLVITSLTMDFLLSFLLINNSRDNPIFKEIIFFSVAIFVIFITIYFAKIDRKANEIYRLNEELTKKINELKKIKHDYASQISYLYGTYLMEDYKKLGTLLKNIINNQDIPLYVKVINSDSSLICKTINSTDLKNIDILIDEQANLEYTDITELDLQKVISNIVRNSVEALNGKGLLMIKSYYSYNYIVIDIQNNGPKIDINLLNNIFKEGFSTKENRNGDNGFGLFIVKEIITSYNGHIKVISNDTLTTFSIKLPLSIKE